MPVKGKTGNGFKVLAVELAHGLRNIEALAESLDKAWKKAQSENLNELEINGAAHLAENFYTAIEDLFLRIAKSIDQDIPSGEQWHRDLLQRMAYDIPEVRPAVISAELGATLDEYRRFRHRARHIYAPPIPDWDKFSSLVEQALKTYTDLAMSIKNWLQFLYKLSEELSSK
ncbi:MAG: hypothetical protein PWP65_92 [Clostridia bacterium]|nr:hypothetical protein [Clostridia bacterium]